MKVPLRFQITEFDCGTVALTNAVSYLFERDEIPAELIKEIATYTLDCYDDEGNIGEAGTSREAIEYLSKWITNYSKIKDFKIKCYYFENEKVNVELIKECIENKGVAFLRTYLDCEHYVIITDIDEEKAYIFDSYYLDSNYYDEDKKVKIIFDKPFNYNRVVSLKRLDTETSKDFSLGPIEKRECVCIYKK